YKMTGHQRASTIQLHTCAPGDIHKRFHQYHTYRKQSKCQSRVERYMAVVANTFIQVSYTPGDR
ncbi:hypothetical protein STEG23_018824, partial [Scotinomys teguina]